MSGVDAEGIGYEFKPPAEPELLPRPGEKVKKRFKVMHADMRRIMFQTDYDYELEVTTAGQRDYGGKSVIVPVEHYNKQRKKADMQIVQKLPFADGRCVPTNWVRTLSTPVNLPPELHEDLKRENAKRNGRHSSTVQNA